MKKKPKSNDEQKFTVIGTSSGLAVVHTPSELTKISEAVSNVIHANRRVHVVSDSKYKPKANKAKVKKAKPKAVKKKSIPTLQAKSKPKLKVSWAESEDMRYAMWWDFHTDLSKGEYPKYRGITVAPYPVSAEERARIEARTASSQREKSKIQAVKACGITPRTELRNPLLGNAPHPSNRELFEFGCQANSEYRKELVDRYVLHSTMTRQFHSMGLVSPFNYTDHLGIERGTSQAVTVSVDTPDMISKLESLVEQDLQAKVIEQPSVNEVSVMNATAQATADVFDIDVGKCMPFAANDTVSDTEAPWVEEKQRYTPEELSILHQCGKEPWPEGADKFLSDYYRLEGARYTQWLARRDSNWLRQRVEIARHEALPEYEMNLGEDIHPLYHFGTDVSEKFTKFHSSRRISLFDFGIVNNDSFKNYIGSAAVHNKLGIDEACRAFDITVGVADAIDQSHITQELADKLTERYVNRREGKTYGDWIRGIESKYNSTAPVSVDRGTQQAFGFVKNDYTKETTVEPSLASPTPLCVSDPDMSEALSTPTGSRDKKGAEIVSLSVVRSERIDKLANLRASLSPNLKNLTPEQREGVQLVMDLLNEALG
jgi:hypothetical protein